MSEQPAENLTSKKESRISEGLILGMVPVIVYALGFVYEMGHLSFYGIPSSLITIDAPAMISATLFAALYVLALLLWLSIAIDSSVSEYNTVKAIGLLMLYFGFFPLVYLLLRGSGSLVIALYATTGAMLLIVILRKAEKNWEWLQKASEKAYRLLSKTDSPTTPDKKTTFELLQNGIGIITIISLPFILAFAAGKHNAEGLTTYDVFEYQQSGEYAVIRIYGDKVLSIPLRKRQEYTEKKYAIFQINSLDGVVFSTRNIVSLKTQPARSANNNDK